MRAPRACAAPRLDQHDRRALASRRSRCGSRRTAVTRSPGPRRRAASEPAHGREAREDQRVMQLSTPPASIASVSPRRTTRRPRRSRAPPSSRPRRARSSARGSRACGDGAARGVDQGVRQEVRRDPLPATLVEHLLLLEIIETPPMALPTITPIRVGCRPPGPSRARPPARRPSPAARCGRYGGLLRRLRPSASKPLTSPATPIGSSRRRRRDLAIPSGLRAARPRTRGVQADGRHEPDPRDDDPRRHQRAILDSEGPIGRLPTDGRRTSTLAAPPARRARPVRLRGAGGRGVPRCSPPVHRGRPW